MDIARTKNNTKGPRRILYAAAVLAFGGAIGLILLLKPAVPTVAAATAWTDTVRRGSILLAVRGPGTLVSEHTRYVAALTSGRVERRFVQPGASVVASSVLFELSNPDVHLEALEADREVARAEADLEELRTDNETERIRREAEVAVLERELGAARRLAQARRAVEELGGVSRIELEDAIARAEELERRVELERQKLRVIVESSEVQLLGQQVQIERARSVARFQRERVAALRVRAGTSGIVQETSVEEGQWVTPGTTLARVANPGRLKAVLRIPEAQARDVAPGQTALVDLRPDTLSGRVERIDPAAQGGTVTVDVVFDKDSLPRGARPDLNIEGTIETSRIEDALYVGRPASAQPNSTRTLWKLGEDGFAERVTVRFGRSSVDVIEVLAGLEVGDRVVLADIASVGEATRIRIR